MEKVTSILESIDSIVWGVPLIVLIMGTGIYLTVRLGVLQFRKLGKAFKYMVNNEEDGIGEVTSFGALCTACLLYTSCQTAADSIGADKEDIVVCSTGVIGQELYIEPFERGIPALMQQLSYQGSASAAEAIMTTDTVPKETAVEFVIGGKVCKIGGIAKGRCV